MKKLIIASLLAIALVFSLCSCAGTSESDTQSLVLNPFETSENENSKTPANDDRYELYDKYQSGALQFDFSEMNDAQNIEYNGEKIKITFSANAASNREDITIGYMAFIGGIPQVISVNGSEEAETVSVNFPKDEITNVSINIKPRITKELEDKKELNLQIVSIFNIGYVPQGKYAGLGFGNINAGSAVYTACLTMNEKAETVELSGNAEFENIPASDSSLKSYTLKKAGKMSSGAILKMFSVNNETEHLILDKSTQTCDVLFDGADFDTYNVFFYVNHKRVQVNGKDYAAVSAKAGYVPKLTATLENVNNHDVVYAIAVPLTNDYTKARILKTTSRLSFSPDDEIITNPATQLPADTSTDVPESEPENSNTAASDSVLYKNNVVGYIDNDLNYLLLYKSTTSKTQISHCTYVPSEDKVYYNASVNDECCFYKMNSDGSNKDKLFDENFADFYVLDNEIVGYYCEGEAFTDEFDACYFCVMDKNGKMIQQINIGPFSNCNRRLVKAGDFICFMSPFDPEINPEFSERSNGVIFYNYKTNELRVQYFDNEIENSYCGITPNGKYLITCVPNDVEIEDSALYGYDRGDTTVNIYDTATGEKLKYEKLGKENLRPSYMNVFNDRVVFMDGWNKSVYMIDSI